MYWNDIIGHKDIIERIKYMLSAEKVPHAMLFAGPPGIGKKTTARVFASGLLCEAEIKPCGKCRSCKLMEAGAHPGFILIQPAGATLKIEQIRELKHEAALASFDKARVCLIDQAESMTLPAVNSLLKLLEEPPQNLYFILLTSAEYMLLPTIVSRCTLFKFQPVTPSELECYLAANGHSSQHAALISRLAGGRIGTAWELLKQGAINERSTALEILLGLVKDLNWIWDQARMLESRNQEELTLILHYMRLILRDIMVYRLQGKRLNCDLNAELEKLAEQWSDGAIFNAAKMVDEADKALEAKTSPRLVFEALLIKLTDILEDSYANSSWRTV